MLLHLKTSQQLSGVVSVIWSRAEHHVQTVCQQTLFVSATDSLYLYESNIAVTKECTAAACVVSAHSWFCLLHCRNVHSGQLGILGPCDLALLVR